MVVQRETHTTGKLKPDYPQDFCPVLPIELIARIDEEKTPILILVILLPLYMHGMYAPLNYGLHSSAQLIFSTILIGFRPRHRQNALQHKLYSHLPDPDRSGAWVIIKIYESP